MYFFKKKLLIYILNVALEILVMVTNAVTIIVIANTNQRATQYSVVEDLNRPKHHCTCDTYTTSLCILIVV